MVKDYEKQGKDFDQNLSKSPTFRSFGWFTASESFSHQSTDKQKRFLRKKLKMTGRDSLRFDVNKAGVGKKERIMVFEKGNYEMGQEVYDSQTEIPEHLRASKKVRRKS